MKLPQPPVAKTGRKRFFSLKQSFYFSTNLYAKEVPIETKKSKERIMQRSQPAYYPAVNNDGKAQFITPAGVINCAFLPNNESGIRSPKATED